MQCWWDQGFDSRSLTIVKESGSLSVNYIEFDEDLKLDETFPGMKFYYSLCGQSYKQLMLVIYTSRVVIWGIFKSGTTLES